MRKSETPASKATGAARRMFECATHGGARFTDEHPTGDCPLRAAYGALTGNTDLRAVACEWNQTGATR